MAASGDKRICLVPLFGSARRDRVNVETVEDGFRVFLFDEGFFLARNDNWFLFFLTGSIGHASIGGRSPAGGFTVLIEGNRWRT